MANVIKWIPVNRVIGGPCYAESWEGRFAINGRSGNYTVRDYADDGCAVAYFDTVRECKTWAADRGPDREV